MPDTHSPKLSLIIKEDIDNLNGSDNDSGGIVKSFIKSNSVGPLYQLLRVGLSHLIILSPDDPDTGTNLLYKIYILYKRFFKSPFF